MLPAADTRRHRGRWRAVIDLFGLIHPGIGWVLRAIGGRVRRRAALTRQGRYLTSLLTWILTKTP